MASARRAQNKIWHQDDQFWETMYPIMFNKERWTNIPEEVGRVITLLNIAPPANILDLCCGPGRHSLELARRGFSVTSVDRTIIYLKMARKKANTEGLNIEFVHKDMRLFCRPNSYDGVINLYTSFGYFEDPKDDQRVLINIHRSLKNNGKLVMDLIGKEIIARIFRERDWHEENGKIIMEERKISKD